MEIGDWKAFLGERFLFYLFSPESIVWEARLIEVSPGNDYIKLQATNQKGNNGTWYHKSFLHVREKLPKEYPLSLKDRPGFFDKDVKSLGD